MKRIELPHEKKGKLRRMFNTTVPTVWAALNYTTKSDFAKQIRAEAIKLGGVIKDDDPTSEGFIPNCETQHIRKGGDVVTIIQKFANDVKLVLNVDSSLIQLYHKKEVVARWVNAGLKDWSESTYKAQELSESLNEE